jgi:hypothetical protein
MADTALAPASPVLDAASPTGPRDDALAVLRLGRKAAAAYGRADLAERLAAAGERLEDQRTTVVVLGEFKSGKSSLVNAIVGADVCPVDVDLATAVPTIVEHAPTPAARVARRGPDGTLTHEDLDPHTAAGLIRAEAPDLVGVSIGLPRRLLADGMVIIDTPGVGGLDARQVAAALGVLTLADIVLYVADGANELGGPALDLLHQVTSLVPVTELVLTKADLYHHLDEVVAANRAHLAATGLEVAVSVTSAELRRIALARHDAYLDDESGVPMLLARLRTVATRAEATAVAAAAAAVTDVAAQLRSVFEAERAALDSTEVAAALPTAPTSAKGGWQQLLIDEIADLTADLDFDLRRRGRDLLAEAERALADGDPDEVWPEIASWLTERAAADIVATFAALRDSIAAIASRVAERFDADTGAGDPIDGAALDDLVRSVLASLPTEAALANESGSRVSSGLNAFRSTFYAFSMFSTVGALVGAVAVAPAALVLGLAVGGKTIRDERAKSRQQRRAHAKVAVRTYLDEVAFVAGKETRDALRTMQRTLRDHFTALAGEQQRSHTEAVAAARRAAEVDVAARSRRLADVDAELGRIDVLAARAAALAAAVGLGGAR